MTRITALLLFILNGGRDPQLQMTVSAVLHALTGMILSHLVQRQVHPRLQRWAIVGTIMLFAIPFSVLSILVAFQTQFYFMIFFAVLAMISLSSRRYMAGYLFAFLSMPSMTPGAFVLPAFMAALLAEGFRKRALSRTWINHIAISGLIFCGFLASRAPGSALPCYASSIRGFIITILATISWLFRLFRLGYGIGMLLYVPLAILLFRACFVAKIPRLYLCMAMFMMLQILSMGYFRGGEGVPPANRYLEIMILGIWLNGMAIIHLLESVSSKTIKPVVFGWTVVAPGMSLSAYTAFTEGLPNRKAESLKYAAHRAMMPTLHQAADFYWIPRLQDHTW